MKILYSTRGSRGDVNPLIEVAALMRNAGHDSVICVPGYFKDYCVSLGLDPLLYPEDSKEVMQNMGNGIGSLKAAFEFFSESVNEQFSLMMDAAAEADALVTTVNEVTAPTIAEYHNIPHYRVGFSPILPGNHPPPFSPWQNMPKALNRLGWKGLDKFSETIIKKYINDRRKQLGLKPVKDSNKYHTGRSHTLLAINHELAPPCETWETRYKYDYTGYCYGQIDGSLDKELIDYIDSGDPPVYIGFGSVMIENPGEFTNVVIQAAKQAGCRLILGQGWTGLGNGHIDRDVFTVGDTEHGSLFPKLAGIVHHGGSGTTHTAARAGIPQFILPQFYDQYYWGYRIYQKNMGPKPVSPKKISLKKMVSALKELTNGKFTGPVSDLSRRMKNEDGVRETSNIIVRETGLDK